MLTVLAGSHLWAVSAPVKLRLLGGRPVVDGVFLNESGPYRFLLDTGAQTNQVDEAIARKMGLAATFRVDMETASGVTHVAGGHLAEVRLGSARAADQEFLFTTLDGVHALSSDIQGVLGQEFLSHFDYRLDFHAKTLDFDAPAAAGAQIPTERLNGRIVLASSLGRLVLDSGSDTLVLFHASAKGSVSAGIRTAAGFAPVRSVSGLRVRIGDRDYKPAQSVVISQPETPEDGLLPTSLFKAVYVSNSSSYAVFE